ncbi:diacylglycerol kinase family protein [Candidatus Woesebacteria bacterium]|nr:diacylglycerol kinase family protein [Candidatus Woesebacteria bacterium]
MIRKHTISVQHALEGLLWAFSSQPNYRIHFSLSALSLVGGVLLHISYTEWLIVIVTIMGGLVLETINTALEKCGDAISEEYNIHIKRAKDCAAGAMFMYAIGAIVLASIIFLPKMF